MAIGALQAGYSALEYTRKEQNQMSVEEFYQGVSSAAEFTEEENDGDVIGLTMIPYEYDGITYGMSARYAKESTEENPVVQVISNYGGKEVSYKVAINEVNPEDASELEMFALLSYADDKGLSDGGTYGSYQRMKVYAMNAEQNGYILPLSGYHSFLTEKRNWTDIIGKMGYGYEAAGVYEQSQNCKKLLWTFFAFYSEKECADRLSEISIERDKTWNSGDMENYHKWTNIYNVLNNYVLDKNGKTQYLETENGRFQAEVRVGNLSSGILGLSGTLDGKSSYYARYADDSTKESPVMEVHITGEDGSEDIRYIYINTVNPENATELEMFAFLLHHEKQGTSGVYKNVYYQARQADFFGAETRSDFTSVKINWQERLASHRNFEAAGALQQLFEKVDSEQMEREEAFSRFAPNAAGEVRKAWMEAAEEIGMDGMGMDFSGRLTHISQMMVMRIMKWHGDGENPADVLGDSVESALQAAKTALYQLEHPLSGTTGKSAEEKRAVGRERAFYKLFIKKLENLSEVSDVKEEAVDYRKLLAEKIEELYERIKNGEPETSYPIGAASFTEKEWEQLIRKFDAVQEAVREEQKARLEKVKKKEQEKERDTRRQTTEEMIEMLFMDTI